MRQVGPELRAGAGAAAFCAGLDIRKERVAQPGAVAMWSRLTLLSGDARLRSGRGCGRERGEVPGRFCHACSERKLEHLARPNMVGLAGQTASQIAAEHELGIGMVLRRGL